MINFIAAVIIAYIIVLFVTLNIDPLTWTSFVRVIYVIVVVWLYAAFKHKDKSND